VRICERETVTSPRLLSAVPLAALAIDWELDEARRSSPEVAGPAARTPMVTADSVARTASGAATWTDRGMVL
jgi:hypothetical protein